MGPLGRRRLAPVVVIFRKQTNLSKKFVGMVLVFRKCRQACFWDWFHYVKQLKTINLSLFWHLECVERDLNKLFGITDLNRTNRSIRTIGIKIINKK